jgi:2'-hydroxyisoflavone reductase
VSTNAPRMRMLVLGGTRFVGRALVDAALTAGHAITLFNRGQSNPELFPGVEKLRGDRTSDLSALGGRQWDVVVDVAAYHPEVVERSVNVLAQATRQYVLFSTLSVYANQSRPHGEEWPLLRLTRTTPEKDLYGARKAACEAIVLDRFGERALIVRAGMIVGPYDPTDRLTYWSRRIERGGVVLAPGDPADPLQFINARDLADWIVGSVERGLAGVFNATGEIVSFRIFLDTCRRVTGSGATLVWVPTERLLTAGLDPWMGIPLWIAAPGWEAANRVEIKRARAAGLTFRPLDETIRETWAQDGERRARGEGPPEALSPERERELLTLVRESGIP